jgi:hypothetical protein
MRTIGHEDLKQMLDRQAPFRLVMAQEMGHRKYQTLPQRGEGSRDSPT